MKDFQNEQEIYYKIKSKIKLEFEENKGIQLQRAMVVFVLKCAK